MSQQHASVFSHPHTGLEVSTFYLVNSLHPSPDDIINNRKTRVFDFFGGMKLMLHVSLKRTIQHHDF